MANFKAGDKIKCIKDTGWMDVKKGDICTFLCYNSETKKYLRVKEHLEKDPVANDNCSNWELVVKPHKHAELIKAWADGAQIEYRVTSDNDWGYTDCPMWALDYEYRIKPEPKPDVVKYAFVDKYSCGNFSTDEKPILDTDNVEFTFDGETGKLKAVRLLD